MFLAFRPKRALDARAKKWPREQSKLLSRDAFWRADLLGKICPCAQAPYTQKRKPHTHIHTNTPIALPPCAYTHTHIHTKNSFVAIYSKFKRCAAYAMTVCWKIRQQWSSAFRLSLCVGFVRCAVVLCCLALSSLDLSCPALSRGVLRCLVLCGVGVGAVLFSLCCIVVCCAGLCGFGGALSSLIVCCGILCCLVLHVMAKKVPAWYLSLSLHYPRYGMHRSSK